MHNINNVGNVLFSQVPTKMRHTNLKLKGVTLATKQEEACMSRRQHWPGSSWCQVQFPLLGQGALCKQYSHQLPYSRLVDLKEDWNMP